MVILPTKSTHVIKKTTMAQVTTAVNSIEEREKLFITLYKKAFPAVATHISKMGGSFDEAKDIFQDALVIYYERSVSPGFILNTSESAYIIGIAKYLWIKRYKDAANNTSLDHIDLRADESDEAPSTQKLLHFLATAGKKCMDLLRSFYYDQQPLTEIAETHGFSGIRSATVQKYKCLEKVRETVKQKALTYDDFIE
jgi:DNA-directed RNA polymerase specialized sigma24 family protein